MQSHAYWQKNKKNNYTIKSYENEERFIFNKTKTEKVLGIIISQSLPGIPTRKEILTH